MIDENKIKVVVLYSQNKHSNDSVEAMIGTFVILLRKWHILSTKSKAGRKTAHR